MATNLRQRRNNSGKKVGDETMVSDLDASEAHNAHHDDGYVLTPLVERAIFMRLDVLPFLVAYSILIYFDYFDRAATEDERESFGLLLKPITWVFGIVLFTHGLLVLWQQWSVSVRSIVGYRRGSTSLSSPNQEAAEALIASWTHCLVEERKSTSVDKEMDAGSNASAEAGIAPVRTQMVSLQKNKREYMVATVDFHDINFRCPSVPKALDADFLL